MKSYYRYALAAFGAAVLIAAGADHRPPAEPLSFTSVGAPWLVAASGERVDRVIAAADGEERGRP